MRPAWASIVLSGAAMASASQVTITAPGVPPGASYGGRGTPMAAELSEVALGGYLRRAVRTRGRLTPLEPGGRYFELSEGGKVVLMPVGELGDIGSLNGRRVEVVGFVRPLVETQGTCVVEDSRARSGRRRVPQSYCDDPDLPPTPDLGVGVERAHWPRTSITVWSLSDITPFERGRGGLEHSPLVDLLAERAPSDKRVRVVGRFCGANLCGGLGRRPHPSAWVLQDEDESVWVIGKEPKGKGWRLDPAYDGDTSRRLEVTGRLRRCGQAWCLRAETVALLPRTGASPLP